MVDFHLAMLGAMAEGDSHVTYAERTGIQQLLQALAFQLLADRPEDILSYLAGLLSAMAEQKSHLEGFEFESLIKTRCLDRMPKGAVGASAAKGKGKGAPPPPKAGDLKAPPKFEDEPKGKGGGGMAAVLGQINSRRDPDSDQEEAVSPASKRMQEGGPVDPEEQAKIDAIRARPRRISVSAGSVTQEDKDKYVKPVHEKTEAAKSKITNVIKTNDKMQVLFGCLNDSGVADVVNAFYTMVVKEGQNLITQGDEGDRFYLVEEGTFDIFVARKGSDGVMGTPGKVMTAGPGTAFGELALMYNAPRAATVTCVVPTAKVWALDRRDFQMLIMGHQEQKHRMYEGWLQHIPLLQTLNHFELSQVSELMEAELFEADEEVLKQGEEGDKFYILEEGEARAYISGESGEVEVKVYNQPGDYFGEIALLTNAPRRATIRCTADSQIHSIAKADFDLIIGPIKDLLVNQIDKYPQYAQFISK